MAVETNIEKRNNKQVQNNNFVSGIPFQMQKQREEADEFYAALSDRDQRMMEVVITAVHLADSKNSWIATPKITGRGYKAYVPIRHSAIPAVRRTEYRPSLRSDIRKSLAYPVNGGLRRIRTLPRKRNLSSGRTVLWQKCHYKQYHFGRSKTAEKRKLHYSRRSRIR